MHSKILIPTSLFVSISTGSYLLVSSSVGSTSVDGGFYDTSFSSSARAGITNDPLNARQYLLFNSFNLIWKGNGSSDPHTSANGFLINVMVPDWIEEFHPERHRYSPKPYVLGDEIVALVGVPFTFAKQLFDKVNDWSTEVNNATSSPKLSGNTNKSSNKLLFSHPWPSTQKSNYAHTQDYIYSLNNTSVPGFDNDVAKPFYFEVDTKDVSAVYAAVGLHVSSIDTPLLKENTSTDPSPTEIRNVAGESYKVGVDFAVIQVKFNVSNLRHSFLKYIVDLYEKKTILPQILNSHIHVENDRLGPIYLGGWDKLDDVEKELQVMNNLLVKTPVKQGQSISSISPSEAVSQAYQYLEWEVYDQYISRFTDPSKVTKSGDYETTDIEYFPNDEDGVLFAKYHIKNKSKNIKTKKKREMVIGGFKQKSNASPQSSRLETYNYDQIEKNKWLVNFLASKPQPEAKWKEYEIPNSYLSLVDIQTTLLSTTLFHKSSANILSVDSNKYLDISNNIFIPNILMNSAGGLPVVTKHHRDNEPSLLGIYGGVALWNNPISGSSKRVGKVTMLVSPTYDLLNSNNSLSYPSLGDSLVKKNLHDRVIQPNRFRSSKS